MPRLPMVHPITWQSHPVFIFTDDMVYMGGHSSGHLVPRYSDYNFTGMSSSLPMCMSFNGLNATEPYDTTHMPPLPWCSVHQVTWKSRLAPWRECLFHNAFMVNLSGNEVICWSKNGSQESNITGFWHSSVLGLDGGHTQKGFMETGSCYRPAQSHEFVIG
jgi:hypothetical protein